MIIKKIFSLFYEHFFGHLSKMKFYETFKLYKNTNMSFTLIIFKNSFKYFRLFPQTAVPPLTGERVRLVSLEIDSLFQHAFLVPNCEVRGVLKTY